MIWNISLSIKIIKSVGEIVKLMVTCPDDNTTKVQVDVDLTKIECHKEVGHDTNIRLTDEIGLVMDYPKVSSVQELDLENEMEFQPLRLSSLVLDRFMIVIMFTKK